LLIVKKDLSEQNENDERLLHYQAQLRTLTLELALAEEQERRRIALGLHDDVGHSLALARIKLGAYRRNATDDHDGSLTEVQDLIDHAIQATRTLTFDLSSPILYELGLEAALESVGERVLECNSIHFTFETDREPKPLAPETKVVLYRSVEELLHNVVKHAEARSVQVGVRRDQHRIEIVITDDGRGYDFAAVYKGGARGRGYGILSIREQLLAIGGRLEVDTAPGRGTACLLVAPLESPQP
jgi:signal transduction histidine kinase